jgi:hypothetical protein
MFINNLTISIKQERMPQLLEAFFLRSYALCLLSLLAAKNGKDKKNRYIFYAWKFIDPPNYIHY